jgi:hypothetical protein
VMEGLGIHRQVPGFGFVLLAFLAICVAGAWFYLVKFTDSVAPPVPVPSRAKMIGEWVHAQDGSRIELLASGTIRIIRVPRALLDGTDSSQQPHHGVWAQRVTATGTWDRPRDAGDAYPVLDFYAGSSGDEAFIDGASSRARTIFLAYGDDLEYRYAFHRVADQSAR